MKFAKQFLGVSIMAAWLISGPLMFAHGIFFTFLSVLNPHPCYWEIVIGAVIEITALTYIVGNYQFPGMD